MKMIAEYQEHALRFEHMASEADDPKLRAQFLKQAADYRTLLIKRAAQLGLAVPPDPPPQSN
jgi:hypothetical protein